MYQAKYESRHFAFEAFDATAKDARQRLLEALQRHGLQHGLPANWYGTASDIDVREVRIGRAYRDHQEF